MAQVNRYPKPYDQIIAEGYALPANGTPVILTNTATIDAAESGTIWCRIFAVNAVEIVNPNTISFVPVVGTTTTEVATWTGGGHRLPTISISAITASANSVIEWAAGELICEFALPMSMIRSLNTSTDVHKYLAIYAVAVTNESGDQIEAYLYCE
jgi:hypothetical protein